MIKLIEVSKKNLTRALGVDPTLWDVASEETTKDYVAFCDKAAANYPGGFGYDLEAANLRKAEAAGIPIYVLASQQAGQTQYLAVEGQVAEWEDRSEDSEMWGCALVYDSMEDAWNDVVSMGEVDESEVTMYRDQ